MSMYSPPDVDEADDEEGSTEPERILDDAREIFLTTTRSGLGSEIFSTS
jgi:hypothetical protein